MTRIRGRTFNLNIIKFVISFTLKFPLLLNEKRTIQQMFLSLKSLWKQNLNLISHVLNLNYSNIFAVKLPEVHN